MHVHLAKNIPTSIYEKKTNGGEKIQYSPEISSRSSTNYRHVVMVVRSRIHMLTMRYFTNIPIHVCITCWEKKKKKNQNIFSTNCNNVNMNNSGLINYQGYYNNTLRTYYVYKLLGQVGNVMWQLISRSNMVFNKSNFCKFNFDLSSE